MRWEKDGRGGDGGGWREGGLIMKGKSEGGILERKEQKGTKLVRRRLITIVSVVINGFYPETDRILGRC